jgi:hypothetical protein
LKSANELSFLGSSGSDNSVIIFSSMGDDSWMWNDGVADSGRPVTFGEEDKIE